MKKLFLLLAAVTITTGIFGQKGKVTSALSFIEQGALDKAKEALDAALIDEKSKVWTNTYYAIGDLGQKIFETNDPKYNSIYADPLAEAYAAYEKAIELDPKGTTKKKIITNLTYNALALNLYNQGSKRFEDGDFEGALKSFGTQIIITESDKYAGGIDTGMYYNAGLAAINCKKYDEAIKYFEKCAEVQYLGLTPYLQIYESTLGKGDTVKAEAYLLSLPAKFPGDKSVVFQLIDHYIKSNKPEEALKYIIVAKDADPGNATLYYASGIIYLNLNRFDEAIVDLIKAIEIKPDVYDNQYGLGVAYINKAAAMFVKANEIMDVNKYSAAIDEANKVYEKALPPMEKARELNPNDQFALKSLQELYYRLRQKDPSLNAKYEEVKAKLATLEAK